jgi:hypothetical protein
MYEVTLVCETTNGVVAHDTGEIYTEAEVRDHLAGWMGCDWVLEVQIRRS